MRLAIVAALSFAAVASCAPADYPSTYPFEDEFYYGTDLLDFDDLPDATPGFTYDDKDPGGYFKNGGLLKSFADNPGPPFWIFPYPGLDEEPSTDTQFMYFSDHFTKKQYTVNFWELPAQNWNCTAKQYFYKADDFPGVMNGDTICNDCCSDLVGKLKYSEDSLSRLSTIEGLQSAGACGDIYEDQYCSLTNCWWFTCTEQYLSHSERLVVTGCFDSVLLWLISCKTFMAVGFEEFVDVLEPQAYLDQMTTTQHMFEYSMLYSTPDRVCHPYSYYHPDGGDDSSSGGGEDSACAAVALLGVYAAGVFAAA